MSMVLLTTAGPSTPEGRALAQEAQARNAALPLVERVIVLGGEPSSAPNSKVELIPTRRAPRVGDLLAYASRRLPGRKCVMVGSGVTVEPSLSELEPFALPVTCLFFGGDGPAPSRPLAAAFRSPLPPVRANFALEAPEAAGRLAHELLQGGVTVRDIGSRVRATFPPSARLSRPPSNSGSGPDVLAPVPPGPKVIGVGLQRTGTGSLRRALNRLGIPTLEHYGSWFLVALRNGRLVFEPAADHELFQGFADSPVPLVYRDLDRLFPGSRFVLTTRRRERWLQSVAHLFEGKPGWDRTPEGPLYNAYHEATYGVASFDPVRFGEAYDRHVEDVMQHFQGRPDELLVLDTSEPSPWEPLCRFLGRAVPPQPYPHANRMAGGRWMFWRTLNRLGQSLRRRLRATAP